MTTHQTKALFLVASLSLLSLTGCKKLFEQIDCDVMCDSYADCEDADLNKKECKTDCFDAIDGNKDLEEKADECANCISDFHNRTCSEVSAECDECDDVYATFLDTNN